MEQVIIMGAGPAGISAALYVKRSGADPLVLDNGIGALEKAEKIENYYGLERPLSGAELYERGLEQARALDIRILKAQVLEIGGFDSFEVITTQGTFETASVILACGNKRLAPKIKGLSDLEGKGVSYCAVCDAFFYRQKAVAVLGNGQFALHEAEYLSHTAGSTMILTDGKEPEFDLPEGIEVLTGKVEEICGPDRVTGVKLQDGEGSREIPVDGLFVAIGTAGSASIARQMGAELTDKGNIKVDDTMQTTIPGLFAAGDCTGGLLQVAKAVHEGAQAGLSAIKYVRSLKA
ncbi:MAG: NAD(P)/FAD-dependent oxidoreductase [Blautia sp.]|nr:NAD(P)/FAD-dependent oxidoreductase [Blautia sp.]